VTATEGFKSNAITLGMITKAVYCEPMTNQQRWPLVGLLVLVLLVATALLYVFRTPDRNAATALIQCIVALLGSAGTIALWLLARRRPVNKAPRDSLNNVINDLADDVVVTNEQLATTPQQAVTEVWNIPVRNAAFTGRNQELMELREHLGAPAALPVALYGIGGVGKTQLAIEYAHRFGENYNIAWWVAAERVDLITAQFAALAVSAEWVESDSEAPFAAQVALRQLRGQSKWLLVFDNAEDPAELHKWLPSGGHILITSRSNTWDELGVPVEVKVFDRAESVELLRRRDFSLADDEADQLSETLGDLPLAIAQAAGTLAETGMTVTEYLRLLEEHASEILNDGVPPTYGQSLAAATVLSVTRLTEDNPIAARLLLLCALLAPEPVPLLLLRPMAQVAHNEQGNLNNECLWWSLVTRIGRYGLARIDRFGLQLHRLTQNILIDALSEAQQDTLRAQSNRVLAEVCPDNPTDPGSWSRWASLLPHLLAANPASCGDERLGRSACDAIWYLLTRGDSRLGLELATQLHDQWRETRSPDDGLFLRAADGLAQAYRDVGQFTSARELDQNTFVQRCRALGEEHGDTLAAAHNLAIDHLALGLIDDALRLDEATLATRRRVLGNDHPDTLASANNLAHGLYAHGDIQQAANLDRVTLERRRKLYGNQHPCTLTSANNLAVSLRTIDPATAHQLHNETLAQRRDVLGKDHPHTLTSLNNLGVSLRNEGKDANAKRFHEETLARRQQLLGKDHHDTLTSANNLAVALYCLGELIEATVILEDTLARRRRVLGENHPDTLTSASNLAVCLKTVGDLSTARALTEDTLARRRRVLGENHPDTLTSASNLVYALNDRSPDRSEKTSTLIRKIGHVLMWRGHAR